MNSRELFLQSAQGNPFSDRPPVWFMRQAGRYLPQYMAIRKNHKFWEMCLNPELAAEISYQPIEEFGMDAAIIFSDILLPLMDMGIKVNFPEGGGIKISTDKPLTEMTYSIGDKTTATINAIRSLKTKLQSGKKEVALLGFAGAPWTLSNYILEGGSSKDGFKRSKQLAWSNPKDYQKALNILSEMTIEYLNAQIEAGADAVQLFDSWAGELTQEDFEELALPSIKKIFKALPKDTPKILFIKSGAHYLESLSDCGADVLSLDWRVDMAKSWKKIKAKKKRSVKALQGNLDPLILTSTPEIVKSKTLSLIDSMRELDCGFIANLGHGVTPEAKIECVRSFIDTVKNYS